LETQVIQAAGAVLWRRLSDELIQIALIHRPRYDDWSFPKGKVETGESEISCAFREVLEETGFESVFGPELCKVEAMNRGWRYSDRLQVPLFKNEWGT
jgi:8-oxo-dGTP diphosphatase